MAEESNLTGKDPHEIRQDIEETRSSLAEKLETLEHEVKQTVQSATNAVVDTVETVKQKVEDTVESVKGTVDQTMTRVKRTFDLRHQVEEHPWAMIGGSVAVGFIVGRIIPAEDWVARGMSHHDLAFEPPPRAAEPEFSARSRPARFASGGESPAAEHSFVSQLAEQFAPEIHQFKGIAIGALVGLVRDMVKPSVPPNLAPQVEQLIDSFTRKLGGQPVAGPVLATATHNGPVQRETGL